MASESRLELWLRTSAWLVGSLLFALAAGIAIAARAPFSPDGRAALGFFLVIPLWLIAMVWGCLAKSGIRAWASFLALAAAASAWWYFGPP